MQIMRTRTFAICDAHLGAFSGTSGGTRIRHLRCDESTTCAYEVNSVAPLLPKHLWNRAGAAGMGWIVSNGRVRFRAGFALGGGMLVRREKCLTFPGTTTTIQSSTTHRRPACKPNTASATFPSSKPWPALARPRPPNWPLRRPARPPNNPKTSATCCAGRRKSTSERCWGPEGPFAMSEHDDGFAAGIRAARDEALRIVVSHIERLDPGRQQRIREALVSLEGSLRANLDRIMPAQVGKWCGRPGCAEKCTPTLYGCEPLRCDHVWKVTSQRTNGMCLCEKCGASKEETWD
jgi:hypothetical protein